MAEEPYYLLNLSYCCPVRLLLGLLFMFTFAPGTHD
jgi:hypothetical protein